MQEMLLLRHRAAALLRRISPHLVHLNGVGPSAFFCLPVAQALRVPILVRLNSELGDVQRRDPSGTLLESALNSAAWVVSVSSLVLEQARAVAPSIEPISSVIYTGVDVRAEPPAPAPRRPPRILCLGRLVRDKGFDVALDAFPAILRRAPAARMVLAGDGPERVPLERQAAALGVGAHVDFTGWIVPNDVADTIAAATVVVMPSRRDALPSVALEAAAGGRVTVASRAGGLPEIVRHGETGLLVDLDAGAFAAAIAALLEDPAALDRMGRAAWERARATFSRHQCLESYEALYRRLALPAPAWPAP
jgi:glycogen(starch) synthase